MRVASASQTTPEVLACEDGDGREKYDAYEWCKSELPGCDRQAAQEHRKRHPFGATVVDDSATAIPAQPTSGDPVALYAPVSMLLVVAHNLRQQVPRGTPSGRGFAARDARARFVIAATLRLCQA